MTAPAVPVRREGAAGWRAMSVVGEVLITLGIIVLLYVAYQLWWTNVEAGRATDQVASELRDAWSRPPERPQVAEPGEPGYVEPQFGEAFAFMYIPRLRTSVWGTPIVEGVLAADLARGIGHYPSTAMPGEVGNFAVAGHRATNGEPLRNIDQLQPGDRVYVESRDDWYVYELQRDQLVRPVDTWVITPVPGEPGATPTERLITITTCHPRWGSTQRWIWWGTQVEHVDKATGDTPEAIVAGS